MGMKFLMRILTAALALSITAPALATEADEGLTLKGEPRIAMLYISPRNDGGWTQAFDEARLKLEERLGHRIQYVESVPENASSIRPAAERLIQRGANIIIGTAFGYSDTFEDLARRHPEVAFLNGSGTTNSRNLQSFYGRTYESQYLCGMAAAAASKSGRLGFVAANPFGQVNWTVNAFALGAQKINPDATVTVIYTGSWNDPVRERAAAAALIDRGADVIGQHVDSPTPQIVAQERGVFGTGHHRDMSEFAPAATVCSSVWVWDRFLEPELENIFAGGWKPQLDGALLSMAEGGTDIACCGPAVAEEHVSTIMAAREELLQGNKRIYQGPLYDRNGTLKIADGELPSDGELWQMDWFVKGVITQQ
ncbi:BMP family ABC transporter substrate-binding protein [Alkalilimnicola ehrlichii]|uniref:BMP family ABC transporter substrate-binding protein n=1 Tax=Alkalilimnicola ehrlichii TaxID=351052 RepID=A0A3E0X1T9_9GAMM|nr:BMP family ABC transporter substrate-binding protein [Alkalilimnicola ehrlichii]RFA30820.1 BMP family ABC transporter substrate-binding protein [Alkalilimnicola ehrlichii]RFA38399.1 BMP family ABC transporter substrate-binding protein [Alkalilimnicola ehrlichii]